MTSSLLELLIATKNILLTFLNDVLRVFKAISGTSIIEVFSSALSGATFSSATFSDASRT